MLGFREEPMRKKLAIFCDGTWNDLRMANRTNVSRLAKCVAPRAADQQTRQVVFYDEGVGVGGNISKAADQLVKLWGGRFWPRPGPQSRTRIPIPRAQL